MTGAYTRCEKLRDRASDDVKRELWGPLARFVERSLVSLFCSSHFLKREVETLLPKSDCWLSKGVGLPVARSLVDQWDGQRLKFGEVVRVNIE